MPRYCVVLLLCAGLLATEPNGATRRWWSHVTALANDELQGRDTGSEGYRKAARYVVAQFEKAGLQPAGEQGYYQSVPLRYVKLNTETSEIAIVGLSGAHTLQWMRQVTLVAQTRLPERIDADLVFAGSEPIEAAGKVLVSIGRWTAPPPPGCVGRVSIDVPGGPEPPRWPAAYAVSMTLAGAPETPAAPVAIRLNPSVADLLLADSSHSYQELAAEKAAGKPLPSFPLRTKLRATLHFDGGELKSDNILAALPGSDPVLSKEYVVVSAHLDGYGIGEPWNGDRIYNGAFDDAAYVATLIDLAQRLHDSGRKLKRSLLFAVVTAEEKGLLGSRYFTLHPTVPKESMVADINLDQLRPIFPLKTLTTLALNDSSLGGTVKRVAGEMGIRIQPDPEPERNLLRRSDHYPFMRIGVPAVGFVFGYEKGSPEEAVYRRWYSERYHSPADDLRQPWVPEAAAKFNDFFERLVTAVADAAERPRWTSASPGP